jgi:hypothetical protein
MGGASDDIVQGVAVATSDSTCVVGQFLSTANFGGGDLASAGDNDVFVAQYDNESPTPVKGTLAPRGLSISNYPNPFNPATTLNYTVPARERVRVSIYDVHGALVTTLVDNEPSTAGSFSVEWDGRAGGASLSSGIYFARIEQAGRVATKKMVLLK